MQREDQSMGRKIIRTYSAQFLVERYRNDVSITDETGDGRENSMEDLPVS
jgi:hypothetical protein